MYHIQVVGAGYAGTAIARFFLSQKQKVWALTRTGRRSAELEAMGAKPLVGDLTKPETIQNLPSAHFAVLCPAPDQSTQEAYTRVYVDGIANYLAALRRGPAPSLIVYLSSTGVYPDLGGAWADETLAPEPDSPKGRILLAAERQVLASGFPSVVFRLAGIYGPGRSVLTRFESFAEAGEDRYLNLIHVEDIAGAMPVIFKSAKAGEVYLGVDDEPVRRSVMAAWIAEKTGKRAPSFTPGDCAKGKRLSNRKLKSLGYEFKFPNFRLGYEDILRRHD